MSLLRLADALEHHPLEEAADIVVAAEDREGAFEGFPSSRDIRRMAIHPATAESNPEIAKLLFADAQRLDEPNTHALRNGNWTSDRHLHVRGRTPQTFPLPKQDHLIDC